MKNKSTAIVTAFSLLVFVVLGIVVYQAYKKQVDGLTSSSYIESREDVVGRKKPEPRSIELASKDNKSLIIKGIRAESKDTNEPKKIIEDLKATAPIPSIVVDSNAQSFDAPSQASNTPKTTTPAPVVTTPSNTYTYYAPTPVVVPTPIVEEFTFEAPQEKTRFQSYQEAISRLKLRGTEIIVPIINNNTSLLSITSDSDIYNVLSYEYEVSSSKKGYGGFGTKTHIDTLKCERYISSCKTILTQYPNGRYYLVLANVELYTR